MTLFISLFISKKTIDIIVLIIGGILGILTFIFWDWNKLFDINKISNPDPVKKQRSMLIVSEAEDDSKKIEMKDRIKTLEMELLDKELRLIELEKEIRQLKEKDNIKS